MTDRAELRPEEVLDAVADSARVRTFVELDSLDTQAYHDFARLSRTAAFVFKTEIGLLTITDEKQHVLPALHGSDALGDMVDMTALTAQVQSILGDAPNRVVLDASADEQFANLKFLTGWPSIGFFAGAAVIVDGRSVGSLCVLGKTPRAALEPGEIDQLLELVALAARLFTLQDEARVRARTAAALMREEWRHALTLEAGNVGSWLWDIRTDDVVCNDIFRRMHGLPATGPVRFADVMATQHVADRPVINAAFKASILEGIDFSAEARVGDTGRWLTMRGRIYQRDANGKPLVMMGVTLDITESKQSAEHTRHLLRELNHRVKNTLAMIQSVARQTIRQNPEPENFIEAFSGRLRTISDAHVLLADRDWLGVQLYEVIGSQFGGGFLSRLDRAEVRGDDITLPADHALGLGLILHELTTNAHRHGAWSDDKGTVSLDWEVKHKPARGLSLTWREQGGPAVSTPEEYGLGARLIERSLAKVMDSDVKLTFEPTGVVAHIWMPLPVEEV